MSISRAFLWLLLCHVLLQLIYHQKYKDMAGKPAYRELALQQNLALYPKLAYQKLALHQKVAYKKWAFLL